MGVASFHLPFWGFLVASFFIQDLEAVSCPVSWHLFEQHCYGFFAEKLSWSDAETECTSYGRKSHLASILNEREMDSIASSLLTNQKERFRVWIGLYKLKGSRNRVRWVDASVVEYLPWAPRQPSSCQDRQNCIELYADDYRAWNDQYCDVKQAYICKMGMY
ncbi:regenerating islet-derived protein 4-like [Erythrolamprus reginae]|uniref:regenerating islet-derived protein 4-like n=1 Tax=Erythrolamprus reginae TaxID=121349 RepID=UPI00396C4295